MRKYLYLPLISICSMASASEELKLIDGKWDCSYTIEDELLVTKTVAIDDYNISNSTYTSEGTVELLFEGEVKVLELSFSEKGTFEYHNNIFKPVPNDLDLKMIYGDLTNAELNHLHNEILSYRTSYQTVEINSEKWIVIDSSDNSESICTKI